jgi:DNA-binding response OmpR family regulator
MGKIETRKPDVVLMDVLLGDANGIQLCGRLSENPSTRNIPVILMSSARRNESDVVSGLKKGADDYLVKPITPGLLLAKIEAVLRRVSAGAAATEVLKYQGLLIDVEKRRVKAKGREIELTQKEFDLLTLLVRKEGKVVSAQNLLESVWGYDPEEYNDHRTVHVHISRLKKKLGEPYASKIQNVIGSGYRVA